MPHSPPEQHTLGNPSPEKPNATPIVPDHELVKKIGDGSYGEVWLARSVVGTLRAVKIVYRKTFWHDRPFEREFKGIQKFEPISRSHEGMVDILQIGRGEGCFYYVMELADDATSFVADEVTRLTSKSGFDQNLLTSAATDTYQPRTLTTDLARRGRLPVSECLQIGLSLTSALEHLHRNGLVHRDVKPANIIFVRGVPKLADIGLVAETSEARSYVGTEGFIAPEGPGTPQADIYSLGKLLYEISTGKDRHAFPELPSDLAEQSEAKQLVELNAIVVKACQNDVRERYQSAKEMHADLSLLQAGQSVKQKRIREQHGRILKKICMAAAVLGLTAAAMLTLVHGIRSDARNPSNKRSKIPLANKEYEEGMYCLRRDSKEGLEQARNHFNRAVEFDPNFTMAYNGLFEVYVGAERLGLSQTEALAKLRASASKLMQLDPTLAEAQAAQAWVEWSDWKWEKAEPRFRYAITLNANCAIAHMRYGFCLAYAGRPDEGYAELQIADILDPAVPRIKKNIGHVFYIKRQFREALEQYRKSLELEPSYPAAHDNMAHAYRALGDYTNAIDEFEKFEIALGKDRALVRKQFDVLRYEYARDGPDGYWRKSLEEAQRSGDLYWQAECRARLNQYDQALPLLEQAYATSKLPPQSLSWDECWDPVHADPHFIALLKKTGLKK